MLLDACRAEPFAAAGGGTGDGRSAKPLSDDPPEAPKPVPGLGRIGRSDGVLFAFAAAPYETASDGDGENSPFTSALLRHFGTKGVELKSALTLAQQDVYDRSRGQQLPNIESGLPELVFSSEEGDLPERDQLLLAMAGLTPELRTEVETVAKANNMPLAPLYAAVNSGDLTGQTPEERRRMLEEAARSYAAFQGELVKYASDDPLPAWQAPVAELNIVFFLGGLAEAHHAAGHNEQALEPVDRAIAHADQHGEHWYDAELYRRRGEWRVQQAGAASANAGAAEGEADLRRAIEIAREQGARRFELRAALGLAHALAAVGDRAGAVPVLREALQPFPTATDNIDQREAAALLVELAA